MDTPAEDYPDPERQARVIHRLWRSFHTANSYGVVLLMIVATYVVAIAVRSPRSASLLILMQIATVWLALRTSQSGRHLRWAADGLFVVAGAVAVAGLFVDDETKPAALLFGAASVLYFIAPIAIIRHLGFRHRVDEETMLGALATYLMMGMAFAMLYRCVAFLQSGPFFGSAGEGRLSDDLFFSFVTLTTTGYGNLVPAKNPGQTMAVLEALLGQLFLVVAITKVVNSWTPRRWSGQAPEPE